MRTSTPTIHRHVAGAVALAVFATPAFAPASAQEESPERPQPQQQRQQQTDRQQQEGRNLVAVAEEQPEISLFVRAVKRAGLQSELERNGPFTVFAPTDEAFRSHFDQQELDRLLGASPAAEGQRRQPGQQPDRPQQQRQEQADRAQQQERGRTAAEPAQQDRQKLLRFVRSHIAVGEWPSERLQGVRALQDILGNQVAVRATGEPETRRRTTGAEEGRQQEEEPGRGQEGEPQQPSGQRETMARTTDPGLRYGGARVVEADIQASNGILHVVDAVVQVEARQPQQQQGQQENEPRQQQGRDRPESDTAASDTAGSGR